MKLKPLAALAAGILLLLFCVGLGLGLVFSLRGMYTAGIDAWDLPGKSGLSRAEILQNYDALMDWCSPFHRQALTLPTLPMSADGAQHFAECKVIFNAVLLLALLAAPCLAALLVLAVRRRASGVLLGAGGVCLGLPLLLLGACAVDFDRAFVLFHQIFFGNDLWLFDYRTDPVILILPETYFLQCAVVICCVILAGGAACLAGGLVLRRRAKQ